MNSVRPAPPLCEFYSQNSVFFLIDGFPKSEYFFEAILYSCTFFLPNDFGETSANSQTNISDFLSIFLKKYKTQS